MKHAELVMVSEKSNFNGGCLSHCGRVQFSKPVNIHLDLNANMNVAGLLLKIQSWSELEWPTFSCPHPNRYAAIDLFVDAIGWNC